ncbi:hypothetical protein M885DRAFT_88052 [Pelagophyceae sp. CCMP2097]|nr:hypothetical protein M885DRAFT_88052 [Pelagophyceae sp. CCMP2097]
MHLLWLCGVSTAVAADVDAFVGYLTSHPRAYWPRALDDHLGKGRWSGVEVRPGDETVEAAKGPGTPEGLERRLPRA